MRDQAEVSFQNPTFTPAYRTPPVPMRHDDPYLRSGIGRRPVYSEEYLEEKVRAIVSATTNQPLKLGGIFAVTQMSPYSLA